MCAWERERINLSVHYSWRVDTFCQNHCITLRVSIPCRITFLALVLSTAFRLSLTISYYELLFVCIRTLDLVGLPFPYIQVQWFSVIWCHYIFSQYFEYPEARRKHTNCSRHSWKSTGTLTTTGRCTETHHIVFSWMWTLWSFTDSTCGCIGNMLSLVKIFSAHWITVRLAKFIETLINPLNRQELYIVIQPFG